MLDKPRSEVAWEYWLPTPFASFPFTSPPLASQCAIKFLTSSTQYVAGRWSGNGGTEFLRYQRLWYTLPKDPVLGPVISILRILYKSPS